MTLPQGYPKWIHYFRTQMRRCFRAACLAHLDSQEMLKKRLNGLISRSPLFSYRTVWRDSQADDLLRGNPFVWVPRDKVRGFPELSFSLDHATVHPFVLHLQSSSHMDVLAYYYEHIRPETIEDVLGTLSDSDASVRRLPALAASLPWIASPSLSVVQERKKHAALEAREHNTPLSSDDGQSLFGPASPGKLHLEKQRLTNTFKALQRKGFSPFAHGSLGGYLLAREHGDWAIAIRGGQHRAAALAALGYHILPIRILKKLTVREQECSEWPAVCDGTIAPADAHRIFLRVFQGNLPPYVSSRWPPSALTA